MIRAAVGARNHDDSLHSAPLEVDPDLVERVRRVHRRGRCGGGRGRHPRPPSPGVRSGSDGGRHLRSGHHPRALHPRPEGRSAGASGAGPSATRARRCSSRRPISDWPLFLRGDHLPADQRRVILPILAHPERNERVQRSPDALAGCLNAGAVAAGDGRKPQSACSASRATRRSTSCSPEAGSACWPRMRIRDPEYTWSLEPLPGRAR